jgi:Na+-translocating ferredoxin:NAD+ oxidoreductase subunit D
LTLHKMNVPFIKSEASVSSMMRDMLTALTILLVLPSVHYGARPAVMAVLTALTCVACEILFNMIQTRSTGLSDASSLVTGMIIAMLMPVNAPMWLPAAAGAFAILVVKGPFGSTGHNPFNPAAAGVAFATICWPQLIFSYANPEKAGSLPAFYDSSVSTAVSPAAVLKNGLKPDMVPFDMLWGNFAGPLGTTAMLVIGACGLYLFLKRTARPEVTVCFLAAAALIAAFFPRIACSPLTSMKYELMSGSLFFCSVFLVTDPVTAPHTNFGRCIYGAIAGVMIMGFRFFGAFEQGACFAVLIANAFTPMIDGCLCGAGRWEGELIES